MGRIVDMKGRGLSSIVATACATILICNSGFAQNQLIIGNMAGNHSSFGSEISSNYIKAMGFTTSASDFDLTEIVLRLRFQTFPVDAFIEASLYSNSGANNPGTKLMDFESTITSFAPDSYSVTLRPDRKPFPTYRLNNNTTYWLVVRSRGASIVYWEASSPQIEPSGLASHFGARYNTGNGTPPTSPSFLYNSYAVYGASRPLVGAYFQDPATGQIGVAGLRNSHFTVWRTFAQVVGSAWEVLDFGQYGGTSQADALLRNKSTGKLAFWYANGHNFYQFQEIPQVPPSVWVYHGSGRVNISRENLIFQNPQSGVVVMGVNSGTQITQWKVFSKVPNLAWEILGVSETNADDLFDVLFRNKATGQLAIWRTDGNDFTTWHVLPQVPGSDWEILDILSHPAHETPGLLFQHKTTKELAVWRLNAAGTALTHWIPLRVRPEQKFNYKGFGLIEFW